MKKITGLLFFLLSGVAAFATLLNLRIVLILLFHAAELDLHAWWVGLGRLCLVFVLGLATVKAFGIGKKKLFGTSEEVTISSKDSRMQQSATESNSVARSSVVLVGYWVVFSLAVVFASIAAISIPAFHDLYQSIGANLSELTLAVINHPFAFFALPLIAIFPATLLSLEKSIGRRAHSNYKIGLAVLVMLLCLSLVIVAAALYLPFYQLQQDSQM